MVRLKSKHISKFDELLGARYTSKDYDDYSNKNGHDLKN